MPLLIGVGLAVFQQATGINTIVYYAPTIFTETGFASDAAVASWLFAYFLLPETKGLTLEEIEMKWRKRIVRSGNDPSHPALTFR